MDFSDPKYRDQATGDFNWQGSHNAGVDQARAGEQMTSQLPGESSSSFSTRTMAYVAEASKQ